MKTIVKALLGASVAVSGLSSTAHADDIVRGVIGLGTAIILNEMNRQAHPPQRHYQQQRPTRARQPSAQQLQEREDRREVQRRLNMLGFQAGTADGVYGPRTRAAISAFQASIGQQPSGRITQEQITVLYSRTGDTHMAGGQQQPTNAFPPFGPNGQTGGQNGQQGASAFPPVAGGSAQPTGNAFPPFGGAGGQTPQAAPAFPPFGGAAQAQQGGTAFPALSAGAGSGQSGQQMPAFAAPNSGATATAFPAFGAQAGNPAQAAMPPIAPAAEGNGTDMPVLSAAAAPQEKAAALPSLAAPAGEEASAEAGIALAAAAETVSQTRTLAAELARTAFGLDTQPAVLGVSLGQDIETAHAALGEDDFDNCNGTEDNSALQCFRQTESMRDQLRLLASAEQGIWGIARTITFKTPVPAGALNERFSASYPELMALPTTLKAISSEAVCSGSTMSRSDLSRAISRIEAALSRPHEDVSEQVLEFSYRCPLVYSVDFSGDGGTVSQVDIAFINATVVDDIASRRKTREQEQVDAVSNDLKL